jgi:hypothetical protein
VPGLLATGIFRFLRDGLQKSAGTYGRGHVFLSRLSGWHLSPLFVRNSDAYGAVV